MSILLVCAVVSGRKIIVQKITALRKKVFCPAIDLQEGKERLHEHWNYGETHYHCLLKTLSIEGPATDKKVKRNPPVRTKEFGSTSLF